MYKNLFKWLVLSLVLGIFIGCGGPSKTIKITDKFEPLYNPNYNFPVSGKAEPSGYSIGIIQPEFIQKGKFKWDMNDRSDVEKITGFQRELSVSIEKILISKGCNVSGPYNTYEEMTFPQRERSTFLIQPIITLDVNGQGAGIIDLPEVGGPNLEAYCYRSLNIDVIGSVEMEYIIYDPLTKEKLERHKLRGKPVNASVVSYFQGYVDKNNNCGNYKSLPVFAKENPNLRMVYSSYNNMNNVGLKILESLYNEFLPQVNDLLSVSEFNNLKKYQDQLREKKRY